MVNGIENFVGQYMTIHSDARCPWHRHGRILEQRGVVGSDDLEFVLQGEQGWHRVVVKDGELTGVTVE